METLFFLLSKVLWYLVSPDSIIVLLVLASWILLMRGAIRWAKRVLGFVAAALVILTCLPLGEWMLFPLETRFPTNPELPQEIHGIIVLGGPEDAVRSLLWGQVEVNDAAERFLMSLALSRRFPRAKVVFTSGSGSLSDQRLKGTEVGRRLYDEQGIDPARIVLESESRNTAENVSLSKALVKPAPDESWVVITSAFHMPRAVGIFCKAAWPVIPYPVDHRTLKGNLVRVDLGLIGNINGLSLGIKEWLGLAAYFVTGRSSALFPSGCTT